MTDILHTNEVSDEQELLRVLSEKFAGRANNGSLRNELHWLPDRYWSARNRLFESGRVLKQHGGPGGSTVLPPQPVLAEEQPSDAPQNRATETAINRESETSLYEPMLNQISKNWIPDEGYDSHITRKTAMAGSRQTGGKWTRPDISVVAIQKFKFLRDAVFDVISFEVKPNWSITVEGVFEALAHRQFTTRAYVIYHIANDQFESQPEATRIVELAEQHGIGVFLAEAPDDYERWTERVRARRWTPDPADLNEFLQRVFPVSDHDEIIKLTK